MQGPQLPRDGGSPGWCTATPVSGEHQAADLSPVAIEQKLLELANLIARGVTIGNERYAAFLEADHKYDVAYAKAYLNEDGPAHTRSYAAELATVSERIARDTADVAYRYADKRSRALENELKAWQSCGASVRQAYSVAGRGE